MPESWDASRAKARELRLDRWGTPEEVAAMAAPIRQASDRRAAMNCLKEIAGATGKGERAVQMWAKKAGEKISSINEKISSSTSTYPADYTQEETLAIIEAGLGPDAAGVYRANASNVGQKPPARRPAGPVLNGASINALIKATDKGYMTPADFREVIRDMAGLPRLVEAPYTSKRN